jgi:hypothetical protein
VVGGEFSGVHDTTLCDCAYSTAIVGCGAALDLLLSRKSQPDTGGTTKHWRTLTTHAESVTRKLTPRDAL